MNLENRTESQDRFHGLDGSEYRAKQDEMLTIIDTNMTRARNMPDSDEKTARLASLDTVRSFVASPTKAGEATPEIRRSLKEMVSDTYDKVDHPNSWAQAAEMRNYIQKISDKRVEASN